MTKLIIDGYNLIRQVPELIEKEAVSLQCARDELLKLLRAYKKFKPCTIVVVFDGQSSLSSFAEPYQEGGLTLCYSTGAQNADSVIIDMVKVQKGQVVVVSSDRFVLQEVRALKAAILDSVTFYQKLVLALGYENSTAKRETTPPKKAHKRFATFKKGPAKRLPKAKRRNNQRLKDL